MANRLQDATSPYLLQHADNPVDWFEWGEEAFEKARAEDKPIFLSVGYSSCHWCHVMAHESFEDDELAAYLNEHFVPVKVDREERPDVDSVYMGAVQAMTGHGGWPMSVFLTPEGEPFFAGTYWPKQDWHGMPGFQRVLEAVSSAWNDQRDEVLDSATKVTEHLRTAGELYGGEGGVDLSVTEEAASLAVRAWDTQHGGFGRAPKFPMSMTIDFLLAHHLRTGDDAALRASTHSLEQMSRGGIYDHVGGGFHRYSVDEVWLVPHFEKMLYDNALLLRAYTHGWQVSGDERFARIARETAEYLLRDMRDPLGGFYSATDADVEGEEGKFFVWTDEEFREVVAGAGEDADEWARFYGVTPQGNWEGGVNILHEPEPRDEADADHARRLETVRTALHQRRETRTHPGLDDKVLTSWNALALGALAEAGAAFGEERYITAARHSATFLRDHLTPQGRLHHAWKQDRGASIPAFLEDVAYLAQALLELYEADHDPAWFTWARQLAAQADTSFADEDTGTYFSTAHDAEQLLARPKELWDSSVPAGSSVMADVHLRLAALTGEADHAERGERVLATFAPRAAQAPTGYGELLRAMERMAAGPQEVAVAGEPDESATRDLVNVYRRQWRPGSVLAVGDPDREPAAGEEPGGTPGTPASTQPDGHPVPLLAQRPRVDGQPAAYVCRNFACERPVTTVEELAELLDVAS